MTSRAVAFRFRVFSAGEGPYACTTMTYVYRTFLLVRKNSSSELAVTRKSRRRLVLGRYVRGYNKSCCAVHNYIVMTRCSPHVRTGVLGRPRITTTCYTFRTTRVQQNRCRYYTRCLQTQFPATKMCIAIIIRKRLKKKTFAILLTRMI